jgi:hypothetical protein
MSEHTQELPVSAESLERKHETSDRSPRNLLIIGGCAAALLFLSLIVSGILFGAFAARRPMQRMQPLGLLLAPDSKPLTRFPQPNLDTDDDHAQAAALRAQQTAGLNSYGWLDRSNRVVRIPIDRAMELILQRGLLTRTNGASQTDGSTLQLIQNIPLQQ